MSCFFTDFLLPKKFQTQTVSTAVQNPFVQKAAREMLVKLTPCQLSVTTFEAAESAPGTLRTAKEVKGLVDAVAAATVRGKLKVVVVDSDL